MPFLFLFVDQSIKALIRGTLAPGEALLSLGPIGITHFENTAGPFSLPVPMLTLTLFHFCVLAGLMIAYHREARARLGLRWILLGGASNLIDRIFFQSVTDYLAVPFHGFWNIADIMVVIGIFILIRPYAASPQASS